MKYKVTFWTAKGMLLLNEVLSIKKNHQTLKGESGTKVSKNEYQEPKCYANMLKISINDKRIIKK